MKEKVLALLTDKGLIPSDKYDEAKALYRKSPGRNIQENNYFNRAGYSKINLESICYALQKLYKISAAELKNYRINGIEVVSAEEVSQETETRKDLEEVSKVEEALKATPEDAKAGLKIREEFPFLNDADCPDKLKILVADRITAWNKYKEAHAAILVHKETREVLSDKELYVLAPTALENFDKNQAIWDELNHYNEHKEILGVHPIFEEEQLQEKVDGMDELAAHKRIKNLKTYLSREGKKLKDSKDEAKKAIIQSKIDGHQKEMDLINAKFGAKK